MPRRSLNFMFKLSTRWNWRSIAAFLGMLVVVAGLSRVLPDKQWEQSLVIYGVMQFGVSVVASLLFFENATPAQALRLAAFLWCCSLILGAAANCVNMDQVPRNMLLPDYTLVFNWA